MIKRAEGLAVKAALQAVARRTPIRAMRQRRPATVLLGGGLGVVIVRTLASIWYGTIPLSIVPTSRGRPIGGNARCRQLIRGLISGRDRNKSVPSPFRRYQNTWKPDAPLLVKT
jgi:hypothetical protein